jgi:hypothetical protein
MDAIVTWLQGAIPAADSRASAGLEIHQKETA